MANTLLIDKRAVLTNYGGFLAIMVWFLMCRPSRPLILEYWLCFVLSIWDLSGEECVRVPL